MKLFISLKVPLLIFVKVAKVSRLSVIETCRQHQNCAEMLGWSVRVFPCLFYAKCIIQCRSRYVSLSVNGIKRDLLWNIDGHRACARSTRQWYTSAIGRRFFGTRTILLVFLFTEDMFVNTLKSHRKIKIHNMFLCSIVWTAITLNYDGEAWLVEFGERKF